MKFGFSTGSLAKGDFERALTMLQDHDLEAIELSALRESELPSLVASLEELSLDQFSEISIHAPSKLEQMTERELVDILAGLDYQVVVHPDIVTTPELWHKLGSRLLIEDMDKRKPVGRTADELDAIFQVLPQARLCLDVGHSRQIDSSLHETRTILRRHGHRLAEVHLSDVNSASGHEPLNASAIEAFQEISHLIPADIPIILETPVEEGEIARELEKARTVFGVLELVSP